MPMARTCYIIIFFFFIFCLIHFQQNSLARLSVIEISIFSLVFTMTSTQSFGFFVSIFFSTVDEIAFIYLLGLRFRFVLYRRKKLFFIENANDFLLWRRDIFRSERRGEGGEGRGGVIVVAVVVVVGGCIEFLILTTIRNGKNLDAIYEIRRLITNLVEYREWRATYIGTTLYRKSSLKQFSNGRVLLSQRFYNTDRKEYSRRVCNFDWSESSIRSFFDPRYHLRLRKMSARIISRITSEDAEKL